MKKLEIMTTATRKLSMAGLKLRKYSPEILIAVGVVGTVASTVMACKATVKATKVLEEAKGQIDTIHEVLETPELEGKYTPEDSKKDLTIVYAQTGLKMAKLYGPAVILGVASLGCMITSSRILKKRNIALAAAYATVDRGFKDYRGRVIERFGEELDRELKYNIKAKQIEERIAKEDGTEEVVTKTVNVAQPTRSDFTRCFDETCLGWERDAELNHYFLRQVQNWANDKLKADGFLFLNDVLEELGIPKCKAGQVCGWVYDEKNAVGDNYVDFGIYDLHDEEKRHFVNGHEKSIWLDFNVDGVIADILP